MLKKWWFLIFLGCTVVCAALIGALFAANELVAGTISIWKILFTVDALAIPKWALAAVAGGLITFFILDAGSTGLDHIQIRNAGNGQYGTSRWMTAAERAKAYPRVAADKAERSGIVVGYDKRSYDVDASDHNVMMLAPPGAGKTKDFLIPSIVYNCHVNRNTGGKGASMLVLDVKGEEYRETAATAAACGYKIRVLDYRHPLCSDRNNMLYAVNQKIDLMKKARSEEDRIRYAAQAERAAKVLTSAVMNTSETKRSTTSSESGEFFAKTAEGLVTAMTLIVSEYGLPSERHLPSVFQLLVELNGLIQSDGKPEEQKAQQSRLRTLLSYLPEGHRAGLFAGASSGADIRTSMNIFSSAMAKLLEFIDAELEQMICDHDEGFSAEEFVSEPTIVYLIVPDEDSTRHLFSSLFIRQMLTDLLSYANEQPTLTLPRNVLVFWDEFGNSPAVKDLAAQFTAARSRGIRLIFALQSLAQLNERYGKECAKIIRDATQMTMFSYTAPTAIDTAQELSRSLGKYTTVSGSRSIGDKSRSQNTQLIGRDLLMPDEIMQLPIGTFVVMKSGQRPVKTNLKPFSVVWGDLPTTDLSQTPRPLKRVEILTESKIITRSSRPKVSPGVLDEPDFGPSGSEVGSPKWKHKKT